MTTIWRLEETNAVAGHAVTILGAPAIVESPFGRAVFFNGMDDGLVLPLNPIAGWPAFTIEILFRPEATGGFEQRFLHLGENTGGRALIELRLRPDGQWYLDTYLRSGENQLALIDESKLHPAGKWYWVALRYDGAVMSHFVDGFGEKSAALALAPLPPGETSLGVRLNRVSWFHGAIREVRFHDRPLGEDELQRVAR